jgi:hypothetical protein
MSSEGSLFCNTCCNTGPRFFRSHPKDQPILLPLTTYKGIRRTYFNQDPHGSLCLYRCNIEHWLWPIINFPNYSTIVSTDLNACYYTKKACKKVACENRIVACKKHIVACNKRNIVCKKRIIAFEKRIIMGKKRIVACKKCSV